MGRQQSRMTVIDNNVEHDLFAAPFTITDESDEFRKPFYLIANMAVGGAFTDAYNLGNPASGQPVSMPFPAEMQPWTTSVRMNGTGRGRFTFGLPMFMQAGAFGIFTDNTPVNNELTPTIDSEIFVWEGTLADAAIAPLEGDNVMAWQTTGKGWFGAGVMSHQPLNLFDYGEGHLNFSIQIPASVTFKIGIIDAWGNQQYWRRVPPRSRRSTASARNGQWGQASIPVDPRTATDLRMLSYSFVILDEHVCGDPVRPG
ncbi:MAG: hypothetical protein R3C45_14895 [Phycisphaerales bacterium]